MPIYEYICQACGQGLEAIQRFNEPPLTDCPACKRPSLKKQMSAAAFQLKGSGWYATDFKNKDKKKDKATTEGGAEAKADAKTDTKSSGDTKAEGTSSAAAGCGTGTCGCH